MKVHTLASIIEDTVNASTKQDKIRILQQNNHPGLRTILHMAFNENIVWVLPEGTPPYTPSNLTDTEGVLYNELRRLYIFMQGGNTNLEPRKRELLFVQLLESVTPADALLLIDLKDKKIPTRLPREIVEEAFPNLLGTVTFVTAAKTAVTSRSQKLKQLWADPAWRSRQIEIFKKRKKKEEHV